MLCCFFLNNTATTEIYTLSLHDALPILCFCGGGERAWSAGTHSLAARPLTGICQSRYSHRLWPAFAAPYARSEEHTSELQSPVHLVCRLLLEKKKKYNIVISAAQQRLCW